MQEHKTLSRERDANLPPEPRSSDYGNDVSATESGVVSAGFEADTGRRVKKGFIVFALILIAAFIVVRIEHYVHDRGLARASAEVQSAPPLVDVVAAKRVGSVQDFLLPGQTAAWHASTIYARVNGYVGKWFVDIGDHVHKGQVLATIETPDLDAQLGAADAQLKASEAQVLVRRAEAEFGKSTYERWRDSPKGVVSDQEREEKRADYESSVARLKSAEAQVALDQAHVNQYAAFTQYKQVTAPFDGVITNRDIDIGNLVTAGSTTATTPLYVMTQNDPMRIFVDVPQAAAADLMSGRVPVDIETNDGAHHHFTGNVTRTSSALNEQARTLRVEVDIPNPQQELVPGMYVKASFGLQPKGLVQVPAAALVFRAAGPRVARVDSSGRVEFRDVTIARDDGNLVELGSGVAPGDRLVLNVSQQIDGGELVKIHDEDGQGAPPPPVPAASGAAAALR
jgi:RND family efflux transporter MFP subunit